MPTSPLTPRWLASLLASHQRPQQAGANGEMLQQLRAAALSAITTLGRDGVPADPNPHTAELTAYDLGRLFCFATGNRSNVARSLDDIAIIIDHTSGDPSRRVVRARWMVHELRRMGHPEDAKQFAMLADPQT